MGENQRDKLKKELDILPQGTVVYKTIKGKKQPYLQWSENGKTKSRYIKVNERNEILAKVNRRKEIMQELKETKQNAEETFRTRVSAGEELFHMTEWVKKFHKRDVYASLKKYMSEDSFGKVCLLYGLRRTGKTTMLFQLVQDMSEEDRNRTVYIKAKVTDTMANFNHDLKILEEKGIRTVLIDEVTLMSDFIDSASLFSDIFAMTGMKIVLSGTDSLGFWFAMNNELYDRAYMLHTTYIPFREYQRLLGIDDIDEYIRYGGTLQAGETAFDDPDALEEDAAFRDDESLRRYIDTSVCRNIQHSLKCCENGNYFRHLRSLYEAGELTGAINRVIESMNHQFLLSVFTEKFKSHDLGSAAQQLRTQKDPEKKTDILDRIDQEAVTKKLMEMLEIRNQEDQTIGITPAHVYEIKEYLKALDLVVDCPKETVVPEGEPVEYVLFTQPGMRYCEAQTLVHVLMKDPLFSSFSEMEKDLACNKILEDVRGRMMEDMILLETSRSLPKTKRTFKLTLARSEFDMVIFNRETGSCEAYEIKHTKNIFPRQYHVLEDEEQCSLAEKKYGTITRRCVIYRGEDQTLENGIEYRNAEAFLTEKEEEKKS